MQTWAVTDYETIKKAPCKGNQGLVRGTDLPLTILIVRVHTE